MIHGDGRGGKREQDLMMIPVAAFVTETKGMELIKHKPDEERSSNQHLTEKIESSQQILPLVYQLCSTASYRDLLSITKIDCADVAYLARMF